MSEDRDPAGLEIFSPAVPGGSRPPEGQGGPAHSRPPEGPADTPPAGPGRDRSGNPARAPVDRVESGSGGPGESDGHPVGDDQLTDGAAASAAGTAAAHSPPQGHQLSARRSWRIWRRSRPFWGGLLVILSGAEILLSLRASLPVLLQVGMQGLAAYLVPVLLLLCGLLLWFSPAQRLFYAILSVVLALASWLTSNLGGFLVGLLLGVIGGSLAFAWTPERAGRRVR